MAQKFAPVVYLHSEEDYFPCTIEYYCQHSSLWDGNECIIPDGRLNIKKLPTDPECSSWRLDVEKKAQRGEDPRFLDNIPFYVNIVEKEDRYQIFYIFCYAYNGPFWLCGVAESIKRCACCNVGAHQADIEHITVEVKKEAYQRSDEKESDLVIRAYFAAHGSRDGRWIEGKNLKWENGRILCYSAKHSHASYQKRGTIWRCLGCINDHTENYHVWIPKELVYIDDTTHWNQFSGYLGKHVRTPLRHSWWRDESRISTNWFCRFFCACY